MSEQPAIEIEWNAVLSDRYRYGGPSVWPLNEIQKTYRGRILDRLGSGTYKLEKVACPLCGSDGGEGLSERDRYGLPLKVVICMSCGLVRSAERLSSNSLPLFYQEDYHGLHFGETKPDPNLSLFREGQGAGIYEALKQQLSGKQLTVVEIGAGAGTVLREFEEEARRDGRMVGAVGCEYSSEYASAGMAKGLDIRTGGIDVLTDVRDPDVIILSHVVEHFGDPIAELKQVSELATDSTLVYAEVPGIRTIHEKSEYEYDFLRYLTLSHTFHFTLTSLNRVFARAGFVLLKGDEVVRGVFRTAGSTEDLPDDAGADLHRITHDYLRWLESSRAVSIRRMVLRSDRRLRAVAGRVLRRLGLRRSPATKRESDG